MHKAGLAMKVSKHRKFNEITAQDWKTLADQVGLHPEETVSLVAAVVQRVPSATAEVVELFNQEPGRTPSERKFADTYKTAVKRQATLALRSIEGKGIPTRRP